MFKLKVVGLERTEVLLDFVETLKKVFENDPTKDILNLRREDMRQAREQDMKFEQMMLAMIQQPLGGNHISQSANPWRSKPATL